MIRDTVLRRRYEKLYGPEPEARPAPKPAAPSVFDEVKRYNATLDPGELAERQRVRASNAAMRQIERALEAEASEAKAAQQQSAVDVVKDTAIGQLWRNHHA